MVEFSMRSLVSGTPRARRLVTIPAVTGVAGSLAATAWAWAPAAIAADLARNSKRLPALRTLAIATSWAGIEVAGVSAATAVWAVGLGDDPGANYAIQRWWTQRLVDMMRVFASVHFEVEGLDELAGGPLVVAPNHTSIADAILPAWLLGRKKMRPRYILKRELLVDPCLDIVGNRVPNHFVIRDGDDTARELDAMRAMVADMGRLDATVIYPEGTVATPARMARALERIAERDPERAARMSALSTLMPPRHAGMHALLEGTPTADVAFVGHSGLGVVAEIAKTPQRIPFDHPVRVHVRRVPRSEIPADRHEFAAWLDEQWLSLDRVVAAAAG